MKNLFCVPLVLLGLLAALGCRAATPAFQDFDGSQFGTNANKVRIKEGVIETNAWVRESFKFGRTLAGKTNLLITPLGTGVILWADGVPVLSIQPGGLTPGTNILSAVLVGGGGTNNVLTNAVLKILQASDGTGIIGMMLNNGLIWSASTNGVTTERTLFGISPSFVVIYTNSLALGATFHSGLSAWTNGVAGQGSTNTPDGNITASGNIGAGNGLSGASITFGASPSSLFILPETGHGTNLYAGASGGWLVLEPTYGLELRGGAFTGNGSGLTNLNYARLTNVPPALSNVVNLASNSYVGTFTGNALSATNYSGTNLLAPADLAWASGSLAVGWPRLNYTHSITSNSWVTGFSGLISGKSLSTFLLVTNAGGSDFTLSVSNSVLSIDGLRSWTVTNKSARGFSFLVGTMTNAASQPFY